MVLMLAPLCLALISAAPGDFSVNPGYVVTNAAAPAVLCTCPNCPCPCPKPVAQVAAVAPVAVPAPSPAPVRPAAVAVPSAVAAAPARRVNVGGYYGASCTNGQCSTYGYAYQARRPFAGWFRGR